VFSDVDPKYLEFTPGIRVLYSGVPVESKTEFTFLKLHGVGEKFFPEGGVSCMDSSGGKRSFYLDEVIIHPDVFEPKKISRGRKKK